MEAASFEESNLVLHRPKNMADEDCYPLSVFRGDHQGNNVVVSCWKVTVEELEEIKKTGRIWLMCYGKSMPPVILAGIKPEMK